VGGVGVQLRGQSGVPILSFQKLMKNMPQNVVLGLVWKPHFPMGFLFFKEK
jgi:hypothetical protein